MALHYKLADWISGGALSKSIAALRNSVDNFNAMHATCRAYRDLWKQAKADFDAVADANTQLATQNAALIGFVEEVRDFKPTIFSGRIGNSAPQDDMNDMMDVGTFYDFQADAARLLKGGA